MDFVVCLDASSSRRFLRTVLGTVIALIILLAWPAVQAQRKEKPPKPHAEPLKPPEPTVRVFIDSNRQSIQLFTETGKQEVRRDLEICATQGSITRCGHNTLFMMEPIWGPVCSPPCGEQVKRFGTYVIRGDDQWSSKILTLEHIKRSEIRLQVRAGTRNQAIGAILLASLSGALVIPGLACVAVAESGASQATTALRGVGYPLLIGGTVGLVSGIIWAVRNQTAVRTDADEPIIKPVPSFFERLL